MMLTGSCVYWLNVWTKLYSILGPTVKAVFEGNVHGVVVQARKCTVAAPKSASLCPLFIILNWATTVLSLTSW